MAPAGAVSAAGRVRGGSGRLTPQNAEMHAQTRHWLSLHERDLRPPRPRPPSARRGVGHGTRRHTPKRGTAAQIGTNVDTRQPPNRPVEQHSVRARPRCRDAAVRASYLIRYPIQWVLPNSSDPRPCPPPLRPLPAAEALDLRGSLQVLQRLADRVNADAGTRRLEIGDTE